MSYVIPILSAVVSIGGSAAINWFTRVRGASIYVRRLILPTKWDITWMRFDAVRGVTYLGDYNNADNLYFTTSFSVAVEGWWSKVLHGWKGRHSCWSSPSFQVNSSGKGDNAERSRGEAMSIESSAGHDQGPTEITEGCSQ